LLIGFIGGWAAGALGLGGGVIYNPALLALGVPPKVSSATGMYIVTFSTFASCCIFMIAGSLTMDYALWIGAWGVLGAIAGLLIVDWLMKKLGRQSIIVIVLTVVLGISVIIVPVFGGL